MLTNQSKTVTAQGIKLRVPSSNSIRDLQWQHQFCNHLWVIQTSQITRIRMATTTTIASSFLVVNLDRKTFRKNCFRSLLLRSKTIKPTKDFSHKKPQSTKNLKTRKTRLSSNQIWRSGPSSGILRSRLGRSTMRASRPTQALAISTLPTTKDPPKMTQASAWRAKSLKLTLSTRRAYKVWFRMLSPGLPMVPSATSLRPNCSRCFRVRSSWKPPIRVRIHIRLLDVTKICPWVRNCAKILVITPFCAKASTIWTPPNLAADSLPTSISHRIWASLLTQATSLTRWTTCSTLLSQSLSPREAKTVNRIPICSNTPRVNLEVLLTSTQIKPRIYWESWRSRILKNSINCSRRRIANRSLLQGSRSLTPETTLDRGQAPFSWTPAEVLWTSPTCRPLTI